MLTATASYRITNGQVCPWVSPRNLLNTLTLPLRFAAAKTKEHQSDARRKALGVALIAQVHLARQRLSQTAG
jgi:hypothetical protein